MAREGSCEGGPRQRNLGHSGGSGRGGPRARRRAPAEGRVAGAAESGRLRGVGLRSGVLPLDPTPRVRASIGIARKACFTGTGAAALGAQLPGSRLATAAWSLAPYRMPKALSVDAWRSPVARKPWVFWP